MPYPLNSPCWLKLALLFFASVSPAHAYLDPGSGSYILQLLLGGFAGLAVVGKLYWNHFLTFLGSLKTPRPNSLENNHGRSQENKD